MSICKNIQFPFSWIFICYLYPENFQPYWQVKFRFPKFLRFSVLAFRYSLFFLVSIIFIFFIAFVYSYGYSIKLLVESAQKDATILTRQTIVQFENVLQPVEIVPQTLVNALESPHVGYEDVQRIARDFVIRDLVVFGSCLAFEPYSYDKDQYWYAPYLFEKPDGIHFKFLSGPSYDYFKKDWYRLPKLLGRPVWTEPYYDKGGGDTLMCTYSVPIYKQLKGKRVFTGVLTMDISLASFDKIVKNIKVYKTGYGFLVSRTGKIITSPFPGYENKNIMEIAHTGKGKRTIAAIRDMMKGNSDFTSMDGLSAKRHQSYLSYAPVSSTGWSFGIIFPAAELTDNLLKFLKQMLNIFGWSILALLIVTILITRKLTRPIIRLLDATRKIGQGNFNAKIPIRKSKNEIAQLSNAFSVMQDDLSNYITDLQETTTAKEKIESELNIAHSIQMGMLPVAFPDRPDMDLYAMLESAKAVGGDLYDFFFLDPDHLVIAIGDVSGKGVPAALFMTIMRTLFRSNITLDLPIHEVVQQINKELCRENTNQMFVTFWTGILDLRTGGFDFCNAGHNNPFIIRKNGEVEEVNQVNGIPVGIDESVRFTTQHLKLLTGETLLLYTDGVTEAMNPAQAFFGENKLIQTIAHPGRLDAHGICDHLLQKIKYFAAGAEQADDITLLVIKYKEVQGEKPALMKEKSLSIQNQLGELEKIVGFLDKVSENWKLPLRMSMELNLVLEELFTNIIFYAFDDGKEHSIGLEMELLDEHTLQVRLKDDGKPFNLLEKTVDDLSNQSLEERKIGGLGIHFVKEMMDQVDYQRTEDKNIVILTKKF